MARLIVRSSAAEPARRRRIRSNLTRVEEPDEPDVGSGSVVPVDVPSEVRSPGKHETPQHDGALPMQQDAGGRVGAEQIERADHIGFQSLDPRQLPPALKPGDLAIEVR